MQKAFDVVYYKHPRGEDKQFSHQYREPWEKTDLHCPRCGSVEVWFCADGGDFYVGARHICTACEGVFYLPDGVSSAATDQDKQRLKHLTAT